MNSGPTADKLRAGDRRALARAITLVESTRPDHRPEAEALLAELLPQSGQSIRLGITGVPGVGKSTFIEHLGLSAIERGHRVAVLAVDPSSQRTGGSILGDKTRMQDLARNPAAFIRPSPAAGTLGGVARRTREALLVCEAAGFDLIIVETVGVGQSETMVADLVDMFLLLITPAAGDELQGIKKGIVELADLVLVNKADGDLAEAAKRARADYQSALHLLYPPTAAWRPPVLTCSALTGAGFEAIWQAIGDFKQIQAESGGFGARRARQAVTWMWSEIRESLMATLERDPDVAARLGPLEAAVRQGQTAPTAAAREVLEAFGVTAKLPDLAP
ncbi:MAG: methylmalonyl Co-A mutase-associated GTPase MeaB [Pseudomonadota bacterium]